MASSSKKREREELLGVGAAFAGASPAPDASGSLLVDQEGFTLGNPALVCRWRISRSKLPLVNRHIRALRARRVRGARVATELAAWVKQQVEWGLEAASAREPDGVLMLVVDEAGKAALTVGPYEPLRGRALSALARRAAGAMAEARAMGVAPEALWVVRDGALVAGLDEGVVASGSSTLVGDLAATLGIVVSRENRLAEEIVAHASQVPFDEAFLVSDEHGIVVASNARGPLSTRFEDAYAKLLERQGSHRRP